MQSCKNTYFPLTMSIHNIRYRESYDIRFRKIFIRLHIHGQTCKLIIVFPMILIKIAIYENQTAQLYFHCRTRSSSGTAIIKCSESFENFIILRKRTYILDALLSKTISLKLFFLSSTLWKGKEGQRRGETSIFWKSSVKSHTTHHAVLLGKKIKKRHFLKNDSFSFFS